TDRRLASTKTRPRISVARPARWATSVERNPPDQTQISQAIGRPSFVLISSGRTSVTTRRSINRTPNRVRPARTRFSTRGPLKSPHRDRLPRPPSPFPQAFLTPPAASPPAPAPPTTIGRTGLPALLPTLDRNAAAERGPPPTSSR